MGASPERVDAVADKMRSPVGVDELDEEGVYNVRKSLAGLWLKALDELRLLTEDPAPIALGDDLMPKPSDVEEELYEGFRGTIEMMYQTLSVERIWKLYDAFVTAVSADMSNKTERIQISSISVLVVTNGQFSFEYATK